MPGWLSGKVSVAQFSWRIGTRKKAIMLTFELGIVTILIVINGLLSMSELAIVSSRPARLAALAERNVKGSRRALALASDP